MLRRLLLKLRRRKRLHEELDEELAFHRAQAEASGNPIGLGNTTRIREEALDLWRFSSVENLWRDVVYAARGLGRSPALVLSGMLSLGLGIGVNGAMFSLTTELMLSQPSVTDPGSVAEIRLGGNSHANRRVFDMVRDAGVFRNVVGENEEVFVNWDDGVETRRVFAVAVTKNYFSELGVPVAHGRGIVPTDADQVIVLRHEFWRRHFHEDLSVVGRPIRIDGQPFTVVGILPPGHRTLIGFGFAPDVYVPAADPDTILAMYGRLREDTTLDAAREHLVAVGRRIDRVFPQEFKYADDVSVEPIAGLQRLTGPLMTVGLFFGLLLAIVGLVLLIGCVNVAGLLLARASARRRELAIRLSLGASRARLLQQLLVESLLLATAGAVAGLALARIVAMALSRVELPVPFPFRLQTTVDWRVAVYGGLMTLVAATAAGLLPAWVAVRNAIAAGLPRAGRMRVRRVLVGGQVAVSIVVLVTAAIFLRNLFAAGTIDPGFDVRHTLRAEVHLPGTYARQEQIGAFISRGLPALQALPGISRAAAARIVPFTDSTRRGGTLTMPDTGERIPVSFSWNAVTPGFFDTLGIPVLQGRDFAETDSVGESVVLVNRVFVDRYLGGRQPIGTVFLWGPTNAERRRVIGVVGNTKTMTVGEDDVPQLYQPLAQICRAASCSALVDGNQRRLQFVLRAAASPALLLPTVRRALRDLDPAAGTEVATLYSSIGLAFLPSQVGAALMGATGLLAILLAAIGLYGMTSYSVAQRIPEIGLRMAVGANRWAVVRLVIAESLAVVCAGMVIGLAAAWGMSRSLTMFLVRGVSPTDPVSFGAVLLLLALTAAAAAWGPARRATRIDPAITLRCDG